MDHKQAGMVFDIQRWSLHDGPGIRTNVFLKGCPLSCLWCSNPESQSYQRELAFFPDKCIGCGTCISNCPRQAVNRNGSGMEIDYEQCRSFCGAGELAEQSFACAKTCYAKALEVMGTMMTAEAVITEVLRDKPIYDRSGGGMTVTGGEPFAQPDFLQALLTMAKAGNLHTVIESCLYAPWDVIRQMLPLVDYLFMDLKILDEEQHIAVTGKDNRLILENMQKIYDRRQESGLELAVRTPVIPGINDTPAAIGAIADWLVRYMPEVTCYELLPYHRLGRSKYLSIGREYRLPDLYAPPEKTMEQLKDVIRRHGLPTK